MIASLHADGILGSDRWTWSDMRELKTGKSLQNTGPVLREGLNSRKLIVWNNNLKNRFLSTQNFQLMSDGIFTNINQGKNRF